MQEYCGDVVVNILQMLRLDLYGGGDEDSDTVEWQCLKNNGVMLNMNQWRTLCRKIDMITDKVNTLNGELGYDSD